MKRSTKLPPDVLILRWGGLHVGAIGRPAIVVVALIVAAWVTVKLIGVL